MVVTPAATMRYESMVAESMALSRKSQSKSILIRSAILCSAIRCSLLGMKGRVEGDKSKKYQKMTNC